LKLSGRREQHGAGEPVGDLVRAMLAREIAGNDACKPKLGGKDFEVGRDQH